MAVTAFYFIFAVAYLFYIFYEYADHSNCRVVYGVGIISFYMDTIQLGTCGAIDTCCVYGFL
jgi:hypothetical protein